MEENAKSDREVFEINYPKRRDEEKIFNHDEFMNNLMKSDDQLLARFTVGNDEKELLFYYGYKNIIRKGYTLGVRLSSGQVFGHLNLKYGFENPPDPFVELFFRGPYNLPIYSEVSGYYYIAS